MAQGRVIIKLDGEQSDIDACIHELKNIGFDDVQEAADDASVMIVDAMFENEIRGQNGLKLEIKWHINPEDDEEFIIDDILWCDESIDDKIDWGENNFENRIIYGESKHTSFDVKMPFNLFKHRPLDGQISNIHINWRRDFIFINSGSDVLIATFIPEPHQDENGAIIWI